MGKDDSMMGLKVKCSLLRLIFSLSVKITFSVRYIIFMLHLKDLLTNAKFVIGKLATLCSEEFMF